MKDSAITFKSIDHKGPTKRFMALAIKPESDEYSMGCHMTSYRADVQCSSTDSSLEAVAFLAQHIKENYFCEPQELGYELFLWAPNDEAYGIERDALFAAKDLIDKAKAKIEKDREDQKRKADADQRTAELREYQRLKIKLGLG